MRKAVLASVVLAVLAVLVTGLAAVNALGASPAHRGEHRRGPPWLNQTQVTTSETTIEGVLNDADWGYIEVKTGETTTRIAVPHVWRQGDRTLSFFKLFSQDLLNIGDNVKVVVVTATFTKPNGVTISITYAKQITDLTTGVEVTAQRPAGPPGLLQRTP